MVKASTGFVARLAAAALVAALAACDAAGNGAGDADVAGDPGAVDPGVDTVADGGPDGVGTDTVPSDGTTDGTKDTAGPDLAADIPPEDRPDDAPDLPDTTPLDAPTLDPAPDPATDDAAPEPAPDVPADLPADVPPEVTAPAVVVVNEVVTAAPNMGPDWVELLNLGGTAADLSGWMLKDDDDAHIFTFPMGTHIGAGEFLVVEGPGGVPPLATLYGFGKADAARLFHPDGTVADQTTWIDGQAPLANSWGRYPDGTGPFGTLLQPTRGAPNVAP